MKSLHLETGEAGEADQSRPGEGSLYEVEMKDDGDVMKANRSVKRKLEFGWKEDECTTRRCGSGKLEKLLSMVKTKGGNWDGKKSRTGPGFLERPGDLDELRTMFWYMNMEGILQSPIWKEARIQTNKPTRCHIQWMDFIPTS